MPVSSGLQARRKQSRDGLRDVRKEIDKALPSGFCEENRVTMYVTGSFGRLEARYEPTDRKKGSDLDIFFMYMPDEPSIRDDLSRLTWFPLIAAVIRVAEKLKFEPFSRDGEFLAAHNVFRIGSELGSRDEDAANGFTARLLLLLEGRPLANDELFDRVLLETISFYFRDFESHRETFRPYALINDILRYWRTMCLNYEHKRETQRGELQRKLDAVEADRALDDDAKQSRSDEMDIDFRAESALDNLKLRYSRLALCFSMVAPLASGPDGVKPEDVRDLCGMVPSERWALAAKRDSSGRASKLVPDMLGSYEGFLDVVADKEDVRVRLRDPKERNRLKQDAGAFGDQIAELLRLVTTPSQLRRLLV